MNLPEGLPKKCPHCKVRFEDEAAYFIHGVQYLNGSLTNSDMKDDGHFYAEINTEGNMLDEWVDPYEIVCPDCSEVLWEKTLMVNEEKFFKKGKE